VLESVHASINGLLGEIGLLGELAELGNVAEVGHELDRVRREQETARTHEANVAHGIADLGDQLAELVEVRETGRRQAQLADLAVELDGTVERVLAVELVLLLLEEANVLVETRLDVVVVEELREDDELATQELVRKVHLKQPERETEQVSSERTNECSNTNIP